MDGWIVALLFFGFMALEAWLTIRLKKRRKATSGARVKLDKALKNPFNYFGILAGAIALLFFYSGSSVAGGLFVAVAIANFGVAVSGWRFS